MWPDRYDLPLNQQLSFSANRSDLAAAVNYFNFNVREDVQLASRTVQNGTSRLLDAEDNVHIIGLKFALSPNMVNRK